MTQLWLLQRTSAAQLPSFQPRSWGGAWGARSATSESLWCGCPGGGAGRSLARRPRTECWGHCWLESITAATRVKQQQGATDTHWNRKKEDHGTQMPNRVSPGAVSGRLRSSGVFGDSSGGTSYLNNSRPALRKAEGRQGASPASSQLRSAEIILMSNGVFGGDVFLLHFKMS